MTILLALFFSITLVISNTLRLNSVSPVGVGWLGDGYRVSFLSGATLAVGNSRFLAGTLTGNEDLAVAGNDRITVIRRMSDFVGLASIDSERTALDFVRIQTLPFLNIRAKWELNLALSQYGWLYDVINEDTAGQSLYRFGGRNTILRHWPAEARVRNQDLTHALVIRNDAWHSRKLRASVTLIEGRWQIARVVGVLRGERGSRQVKMWQVLESVDHSGHYRLESYQSEDSVPVVEEDRGDWSPCEGGDLLQGRS